MSSVTFRQNVVTYSEIASTDLSNAIFGSGIGPLNWQIAGMPGNTPSGRGLTLARTWGDDPPPRQYFLAARCSVFVI